MRNNKYFIEKYFIATTILLFLLTPLHISAESSNEGIMAEGNHGIDWRLTEDGILYLGAGELKPREGSRYNETYPWSNYKSIIRYVVIEGEVILPDSPHLFRGFSNLIGIENFELLDISNVTDMSYMFDSASKLESLDLSTWDTSNVTNMRYMLSRMPNLKSIELKNLDVSNVTDMGSLFFDTSSLESLDLNNWDVSSVTDMGSMFGNTFTTSSKLNDLKISAWNTSNVTNMSGMFRYAKSLTALDLSNWNVSKVTNMSNMFSNASSLSVLDLSSWDTSLVESMSYMFESTNLNSLDLSNWDVSKTTKMTMMFTNSIFSYPFEKLDLSNWNLSGITDLDGLFQKRRGQAGVRADYLDLSNWNIDKLYNLEAIKLIDYANTLNLKNWQVSEELDSFVHSLINKFPYMEIIGLDFEPSIEILQGTNRHKTSVEISKIAYEKADTVILVNGYDFPDALAGGPLATSMNAPILLIQRNNVPVEIFEEIERLEASNVILLGGPIVISEDVEKNLKKNYTVSRIQGSNRFATAVAIGNKLIEKSHSKTAMLVASTDYPDGLGVSPPSGRDGNPILFTSKNSLHAASKEALKKWGIEKVNIIGGPLVISEKVEAELKEEGYIVERISGSNRELTALAIANGMYDNLDTLVLANGYNFPDALAGGPLASQKNAPLLLTNVNRIAPEVLDFIRDNSISKVYILGGPLAVSDKVIEQVDNVTVKRIARNN
ncbi:BspA family leucine-rich repeat surface protein [Oceanobacillus sp. CAU 1775]